MFQARQYQSEVSGLHSKQRVRCSGNPSDFLRLTWTNETNAMMPPAFSKVFVNEAYVSQIEGLPEANYSNTCVLLSLKTPLLHFQ